MNPGVADPSAPSAEHRRGEPSQEPAGLPGLPHFADVDLAGLCAGSEHPVLSGVVRRLLPRADEAHAATIVAYYEDSPTTT